MSPLFVILLLTFCLFCPAQSDVSKHYTVAPLCSASGVKELTIRCSHVSDFSDITRILGSTDQRVASLRIRQSPRLNITRADMDNPAFVNLEMLALEECGLISYNSEPFRGLTQLKTVYIFDNNISSIHADTFSGLESIEVLHLTSNKITTIDAAAFKVFRNLTELALHGNMLTSIDDNLFQGLGLTTLSLGNNFLTSVDERMFSGLSKLTTLGLSVNKFKAIGVGAFQSLTSLQILDLSDTQLEGLDSKLFENNKLLSLYLTGTDMEHIENFSLNISTLEILLLDRCNIKRITANFFQNLPKLKALMMDSNLLTSLDDNLLTHLPELRMVKLKDNNLTSLSVSGFTQMYQILNRSSTVVAGLNYPIEKPSVEMRRNPWNCQTQEMTELREWMGVHNLTFDVFFDCK